MRLLAAILALLVLVGCDEPQDLVNVQCDKVLPVAPETIWRDPGEAMLRGAWSPLYAVPTETRRYVKSIRCENRRDPNPVVHIYPIYAFLPAESRLSISAEPPANGKGGFDMSVFAGSKRMAGPFFVPYNDTAIECSVMYAEEKE